ncbi:MAG: Gfo/Idh/MocA family oxidoreductase, partial [Saprospiraceae bacterium]
ALYPSLKTVVAFPRRSNPKLIKLKKEIDKGTLGKIIKIDATTYEPFNQSIVNQKHLSTAESYHKGIFMDVMLNDIDMVHWLVDSAFLSVFALGNAIKHPKLIEQNDADTTIVVAQMENGALVNFTGSRIGHKGFGFELTVTGTKGQITINEIKHNNILFTENGDPTILQTDSTVNDYVQLQKDLVDAVVNGSKIESNVVEATDATRVAVAMTKSYLLNKVVTL